MAPKEPYRESEWADVSPLLKYISGAVAPRLKAPKGPYQASWNKVLKYGIEIWYWNSPVGENQYQN